MATNLHKNSDENNKHTPKGFSSASNMDKLLRDEKGESTYTRNNQLPSAINFVDGNAAPPTSVSGNIYVLIDEGNGAVNSAWDGASYNDWVRYDGTLWYAITPENGDFCFDQNAGIYKLFSSSAWADFDNASNIMNTNGLTLLGNYTHDLSTNTLAFNNGSVLLNASSKLGSEDVLLGGIIAVGDDATQQDNSAVLSLNSTDGGFLVPRMTTAQKNGITSPATSLLVYDTDLDRFEYYNGSAWKPLSVGFDIIEVLRDSDNGIPNFYSDLQSALETCKASGSNNIVRLHSDISLSSEIVINEAGTGTGNAYQFESLTIDFNGFKITYDSANTEYAFLMDDGSTSTRQTINFINGKVERLNATGGGAIFTQNWEFHMENMEIISNTGGVSSAFSSGGSTQNWGGSRIITSGSQTAAEIDAYVTYNFYAENTGSGYAVEVNSNYVYNFTAISNSGTALRMLGGNASYFKAKSNSGYAVWHSSSTDIKLSNFIAESSSSAGIRRSGFGTANWELSNFKVLNGGIELAGSITTSRFTNFEVFCDFASALRNQVGNLKFYNGTFINEGAYHTAQILTNNIFENVSFIGNNFETLNLVDVSNANDSVFKNCNITCLLDTTAGHAVDVGGIDGGNADFMNCTFEVVNAGANCITSGDAETITVANCTFKGATTPINANVTITASTDEGNGNRSI